MKRSKFTDEQISAIVKEGEAGRKVSDLARAVGITEQTYYSWRAKYGGKELSEVQRLKQLEDENRRLKHIVAEQTLDIQALKAVVEKSGRPRREAHGGGWLVLNLGNRPCEHAEMSAGACRERSSTSA